MNILIVEDHPITIMGLNQVLHAHFEDVTIHEATNGVLAAQFIAKVAYELCILDIMLPNTDTHAFMHQLLKQQPNCKVLVYTNSPEASYARKYISLGACGYINKLASSSEFIIAIQVVLAGQVYVSEMLMRQALGAKSNVQINENPFDRLTHRESELLTHILKGYKNHEICEILNIEPSTVATIKVRLMRKLGVHNMVDLLTLAQQHRLV